MGSAMKDHSVLRVVSLSKAAHRCARACRISPPTHVYVCTMLCILWQSGANLRNAQVCRSCVWASPPRCFPIAPPRRRGRWGHPHWESGSSHPIPSRPRGRLLIQRVMIRGSWERVTVRLRSHYSASRHTSPTTNPPSLPQPGAPLAVSWYA